MKMAGLTLLFQAAAGLTVRAGIPQIIKTVRTASPSMAGVAMAEADGTTQCWMLALTKLSDAGADAIADVLSQAQKQGNWLRGLEGTVLIESEDNLQILAEGPNDRLDSFATWCRETLAGAAVSVSVVDQDKAEYCSLLPLTKSFSLAGSGEAFETWQNRMKLDPGEDVAGWSEEAQF